LVWPDVCRDRSMTAYYDVIVIGGGSGGSAFSKRAAGYGAKVVLIERGPSWNEQGQRTGAGPGGTCVNVGCVPKKLMFMAAAHREMMVGEAATAKGYGFAVPEGAGKVQWEALQQRRDEYVKKLNKNYTAGWQKEGVEIVEGTAQFVDSSTVEVQRKDGSKTTLRGKKILIACGGIPDAPPIPGIEHAINSDGFFELKKQPKKVAVIGAGYIAVEMAGILHALGSETHLYFRGDTVLRRGFDPFIVKLLMEALEHHGPVLHGNSQPARITKQSNGLLTYSAIEGSNAQQKDYTDFDCILLAIGRKPVTDQLGLQKCGVLTNKSGHVVVDAFENTNVPGIYAIGDATSTGFELTPVAIAAGRRLADRLFLGEGRARIAYEQIATVVFSHPPIGCIGLTEPQAFAEFGEANVKVKQSSFASMLYAFNDDGKKVKTGLKLVLKMPEERVVGLHCIGPYSDEMMQGFAVAVRMGATRADFEASVAIHPTIAEEFVTFGGWGQEKNGDQVRAQLPPYLKPKPVCWLSDFATGAALGAAAAGAIAAAVVAMVLARSSRH